MTDATRHLPSDELATLTAAHCDGELARADVERLQQILLQDAGARAFFRRYLALDAALRDHGESAARAWISVNRQQRTAAENSTRQSPASRSSRGQRAALAAGVATMIAFAMFAAWAIVSYWLGGPRVVAALEGVAGDVHIVAASGQSRPVATRGEIRTGDTIRTVGDASVAVIAYADGTRLTLVGDTTATCGNSPAKSIVVHHGTLAASVARQPRETPMVLATPSARVEVVGTRFLIKAAAQRTNLSVTEGLVRLVRLRDGQAVDVSGGERAVVTQRKPLVVEAIPPLADSWNADFETDSATGWEFGEIVTNDLPAKSRGALRAMRHEANDGETYYSVATDEAWGEGLFASGRNAHIHITYKMDRPDWLNLFISTRTDDAEQPEFSGNFVFNDFPQLAAGQWVTITIPLAKFRKLHPGAATIDELVPYKLIFNATAPDRQLVVDRVWVTPDGPGEVQIQQVK
jgi:ferric-dicitrate binding protein FerR (iron transport regulator)